MFIVNGVKVPEMKAEARFISSNNELMIAGISNADSHLNITCFVWEEDGLSSNNTRSFTLHVIDAIERKFSLVSRKPVFRGLRPGLT